LIREAKWTDLSGFDLRSLFGEGMERVRELSGKEWTDFAAHDPGVTMLEHLCYALSELAYFTAFELRDHLTSGNGRIDQKILGLYGPEELYPCRPVTPTDLARLLVGKLSGLEDAGVLVSDAFAGVLLPWIRPDLGRDGEQLRRDALRICHAHRIVGEDFESPAVPTARPCLLEGEIELDGSCPASQVLAEVFALVWDELSAGVCAERNRDALARGVPLEEILSGPFLGAVWIPDEEFRRVRRIPTRSFLAHEIERIPGVVQAKGIALVDPSGSPVRVEDLALGTAVPHLLLPHEGGSIPKVKGGAQPQREAVAEAVKRRLQRRSFERAAIMEWASDGPLVPMEPGRFRDLDAYTSIQTELPGCYGVGKEGVPYSEPERRELALQLKGYLFPFEQAMADFQAAVGALGRSFSLDEDVQAIQEPRFLDDADVPGIGELYRDRDPRAALRALAPENEASCRRRLEILDHMLAGFGEMFPAPFASLRDNGRDPAKEAVEVRLEYLRELPVLGRDRMGGCDLLTEDGAPWERRVGLLLGLRGGGDACGAMERLGIRVLDEVRWRQRTPSFPGDHSGLEWPNAVTSEVMPLRLHDCVLGEPLLRLGGNLDRYRLLVRGGETLLLFQPISWGEALRVAAFPDRKQAELGAARFAKALRRLEREAEAIHLVEHLLLRPRGRMPSESEKLFCDRRVTVLLPAWIGRARDRAYRSEARMLIGRNLPAHLLMDVRWIGISMMAEFEKRWRSWRELLRSRLEMEDLSEIDRESSSLREWISALPSEDPE
jgi:hypothetical protein